MTFDADHTHAEPSSDALDPGAEAVHAESGEAVDAEIAAWQARLRQVQEMRRLERPIKSTAGALDNLEQLRGFAMGFAERLDREGQGMLREAEREAVGYNNRTDISLRFVRVARAVRQIVVLEQEVLGLRPVAGARAAAAQPASDAAVAAAQPEVAAADRADYERGDFERPDHERPDHERPDHERSDLTDRPDLDDYDDYDDGPMDQVVAALRRDLGAPLFISPSPLWGEGRGEGAVEEFASFVDREEAASPSFGIMPGCAGPSLRNPLPAAKGGSLRDAKVTSGDGARGNMTGFERDHRERAPP